MAERVFKGGIMKKRKITGEYKRNMMMGYSFILPAVIFMLALIGYPIIYNIIISFQDATALTISQNSKAFAGLKNYRDIFGDPLFWTSFKNTFVYTGGCLVFQFVIGFALALFFSKKFTFSRYTRGLIVISWMLPVTVTALTFKFMFAEGNGIINEILLSLHLIKEPIGWLIERKTAMLGVVIANSWVGIPFNMLLLSNGLGNISEDVYESAGMDGANKIQRFFHITLPLLKPTILSVLILGFVLTFKVFDLIYVMTSGGPVDATEVLSTYSYQLSFKNFNFGNGSAAANVLFLCLFIVGLVYLKFISDDEVM